jgi:hypothetical protein
MLDCQDGCSPLPLSRKRERGKENFCSALLPVREGKEFLLPRSLCKREREKENFFSALPQARGEKKTLLSSASEREGKENFCPGLASASE